MTVIRTKEPATSWVRGVDAHLDSSNSYNDADVLGGSGSGGSIYLKAANLVINSGVNISANGGAAAPDMDRGAIQMPPMAVEKVPQLVVVAGYTWKEPHLL